MPPYRHRRTYAVHGRMRRETDRGSFNRFYSIGKVGAWQMQADIKKHQEEQQQKKRDAVMDLISGWTP